MMFSGNDGILYVDDTPLLLEMVEALTRKWGFKVFTATSPEDAKKIFNDHAEIRLIFVDMHLGAGKETGLELINYFASFREQRAIKLALLTGDRSNKIKELAPIFGADSYMQKPVAPSLLKTTIMQLLEVHTEEEVIRTQQRILLNNTIATLEDSNVKPLLWVKELTTSSMVIESSAEIVENTILKIHSPKLARMIQCSPFFTLKCQRCRSFSQIEKTRGSDWSKGRKHLSPNNPLNFLLRLLIMDLDKETQSAIEYYQRETAEKDRQQTTI